MNKIATVLFAGLFAFSVNALAADEAAAPAADAALEKPAAPAHKVVHKATHKAAHKKAASVKTTGTTK